MAPQMATNIPRPKALPRKDESVTPGDRDRSNDRALHTAQLITILLKQVRVFIVSTVT